MVDPKIRDDMIRKHLSYWRVLFQIKFRLPASAISPTMSGITATVGNRAITLAWDLVEPGNDDACGEFVNAVEKLVKDAAKSAPKDGSDMSPEEIMIPSGDGIAAYYVRKDIVLRLQDERDKLASALAAARAELNKMQPASYRMTVVV